MRRLFAIVVAAFAAAGAADAAAQSDASISFENQTCGTLNVTLNPELPCAAFSTGCRVSLAPDDVRDVDFVPPQGLDILDMKIEGRCPGPPETLIAGHCAIELSRLFPDIRERVVWPDEGLDPVSGYGYVGDDVNATYGGMSGSYAGPGSAGIDISFADCQTSADGERQVCAVACQHLLH